MSLASEFQYVRGGGELGARSGLDGKLLISGRLNACVRLKNHGFEYRSTRKARPLNPR